VRKKQGVADKTCEKNPVCPLVNGLLLFDDVDNKSTRCQKNKKKSQLKQ